MRRSVIVAVLAGLSLTAQQDYRLRVTVDLVQVDATVTDSKGQPVPDLTAADFRVLLDGHPEEIKYCSYVRLSDARSTVAVELEAVTAAHPAMPALPVKREDVRRTIVLFVGDLLTSSESMPGIRAGLKKFVQDQVQPGDLIAIVRSSAGLGALQDFTTDKHRLLAAIEQVRWTSNAIGIGGASAYEQIGQPALGPSAMTQLDKIDSIERATLATTSSLLPVVRGMAGLPGRKSLVILSDGLRLTSPDEVSPAGDSENGTGAFLGPIYRSMRLVVDESVRAGVVVYAIDTRGQSSLLAGAADRLKPSALQGRRADYRDNQWGSMFLSSQTGGFMITEANRIEAGLERVIADQRGYYLLGFRPPSEAMRPGDKGIPDYHKLKIEVLKAGLKVRSHAGFFGVPDEEAASTAPPALQLSKSLESPPGSPEIPLDVETGYLGEKNDHFIRATLHIDARSVVLKGPPIHRTGVLHVIVRAFNVKGEALRGGIDQVRRIDLNEEGYERALKYGLIYTTLLPAPKPGPYQIRAACRDEATGKLGTGGDFVSIPPSSETGLRLSGIIFQHDLGTDDHIVPASGPSVYSAGQSVRFTFQIASGGPKPALDRLEMRMRLYRDGDEVWKGAAMPVESDVRKTAYAKGSLEVPKGLVPGRYLLRVDIADTQQPDQVLAWQWGKLSIQ